MKKWASIVLLSLCSIALSGCGYSEDVATIYVLTPAEKSTEFTEASTRFTSELGTIAKQHGLSPSLGRSPDAFGYIYYVVLAEGEWLRLWGTNLPLSGRESMERCGDHSAAGPDPGQYVVTLDHSLPAYFVRDLLPETAQQRPGDVLKAISKELVEAGYEVRSEPVECSPLAKQRSRPKPPKTAA